MCTYFSYLLREFFCGHKLICCQLCLSCLCGSWDLGRVWKGLYVIVVRNSFVFSFSYLLVIIKSF